MAGPLCVIPPFSPLLLGAGKWLSAPRSSSTVDQRIKKVTCSLVCSCGASRETALFETIGRQPDPILMQVGLGAQVWTCYAWQERKFRSADEREVAGSNAQHGHSMARGG